MRYHLRVQERALIGLGFIAGVALPMAGQPQEQAKGDLTRWTLNTTDTTLVVGVGADQKLYL